MSLERYNPHNGQAEIRSSHKAVRVFDGIGYTFEQYKDIARAIRQAERIAAEQTRINMTANIMRALRTEYAGVAEDPCAT